MSRAFRIKVQESLRTVVKGSDHIGTRLELLEVLPQEQMGELLAADLEGLGFEREGDVLVREQDGVRVEIDPKSGDVKVSSELCDEREFKKTATGWGGDTDRGLGSKKRAEDRLREQTKKDLETQAQHAEARLTEKATEQLEAGLRDLQGELDGVVNRVTAQALKQKAASLGEIKSVTEDTDNGSMTIVLEV